MTIARVMTFLPVFVFSALGAFLYFQLFAGDPSRVPTALENKPVPEFALPALEGLSDTTGPVPGFASTDFQDGRVRVVNIWASWCVPCREEHPYITALAEDGRFDVFGLNYKDQPENARRFLGRYGNPFDAVGVDQRGRIGIDWGVYGVPETFIVDGQGRIVFKYIGPINQAILDEVMLPEIEKALEANEAAPDAPAVGS